MAPFVKITVGGLDEAIKKFNLLPGQIDNALRRGIEKIAYIVENYARQRSPVDTGTMYRSIHTFRGALSDLRAEVYPTVNYAIFVHEGTRFIKANPFMTFAANDAEKDVGSIMEGELRRATEQ